MRWLENIRGLGQSRAAATRSPAKRAVSPRPIGLMLFVGILLLMGGSSRTDLPTLVVLRPLAVLMLGYAIVKLSADDWRDNKFIIAMMGMIILLPVLQLIPLPPGIWHALAGRDIIREIDAAAGIEGLWRPLTMSPAGTWNALFSLAVPAAVLFAGLSLDRRQRYALVPYVLALILASAMLGLLQILGPNGGSLYLYRVTHPDSAVGFLANRNHHAAFVAAAFPILAVLASDPDHQQRFYGRPVAVVLIGIFLVPMILVIGSRMGLVVAGIAIAASPILYLAGVRGEGRVIDRRGAIILASVIGLLIAMVAVALAFGRAEALQRVAAWSAENDERLQVWKAVANFGGTYWPWGTGFGSFVEIYKVHEPREMLTPAYFNQAHNDWLEVVLTGGFAAAALLVVAFASWARRAWQLRRSSAASIRDDQIARLGIVIVFLFALASLTDYPVRVPSIAAIFMIAVLWTLPVRRSKKSELG